MQQHLFMAYSCNYNPMCMPMREKVKDSLVFDMDRKSIYAQNEEFGYIANVSSEVTVRNSQNTNTSTIILTVKDGVAQLSEYLPLTFNSFIPNYTVSPTQTVNNNTVIAGSIVTISGFAYMFSGTGPGKKISITNTTKGQSILDDTDIILNSGITSSMQCNKSYKINDYTGSYIFTATAADSRMINSGESVSATTTITWKNHIIMGNIDGISCDSIKTNIQSVSEAQKIFKNESTYVSHYYVNSLSSDYKCGTSASKPITCTNAKNSYVFFAIPSSLATSKHLTNVTGVLGGASIQEFSSPVTVSYTNSANFSQNYNIYVATGQNWTGSTFYIQ